MLILLFLNQDKDINEIANSLINEKITLALCGKKYKEDCLLISNVNKIYFPVVSTENLNPRDMGEITDIPRNEAIKLFPRRKWLEWERNYFISPPQGESYADIAERVLPQIR